MSQVASSTMKADPTAATRALLALAQKQWEHQRDEPTASGGKQCSQR